MVAVVTGYSLVYDLGLPISLLLLLAFLFLVITTLGMLVQYFTVDKFSDYVSWKLLWGRSFHKYEEPDETQKAIKELESNPDQKNKEKVNSLISQKEVTNKWVHYNICLNWHS